MSKKQKIWSGWLLAILLTVGGLVVTPLAVAANPSIALVLGGGSARGFSHIGLIKALEENGIPIDMIVGTSMGSIVAGLYAAGYSVDNMAEITTALDASRLLDIPMPLGGGVVDSTGIEHFLDILLGGRTYDELPMPFSSVIVNLGTGEDIALSEGKVSKGIQASISIPGIFPPVQIGDHYYVDGGLKNQVPANVAADLGADVIIAVSLEKDYHDPNYRRLMNNLRMSLTAMLDGYTEMNTAMADVLIVPEVGLDSSMDYRRASYFIQQGYEAGLKYMEQIKLVILSKDPAFEFTPYNQPGYSNDELREIVQTAERSVENLPKRFTFRPEFQFDSDYNFPKFGFKFTHGPLSWFGVGYRHGFDPDDGGHEAFVDWGRTNWGSVDLFIRQSANREQPTFGASVVGPTLFDQVNLEATYVSRGHKAWQISASSHNLVNLSRAAGDVSLRLTGLRPEEEMPIEDTLLVAVAPQVQFFPWGDESFPVGVALLRPYFLSGVTLESPITELDVRPSLRVGIGSELDLFGLYPSDLSLGVEVDSTAETTWKFGITGLKF